MKKNCFSVSMCVYSGDNANNVKLAVDSILNQTLPPDEVVIVVDGPIPDKLNTIVNEYENNNLFKIIRLKTNMGHGVARKTGLEQCKYDMVAIMDADDLSVSNRFELQIAEFIKKPQLSVVGGQIREFIESPEKPISERNVPLNDSDIKNDMKIRCAMNLVTVMFKKNDIQKVGGFIDWYCEEDYYLWIRMIEHNMLFANVPQCLVNVRVGPEMYQRRGGIKYFASELRLQNYMLKHHIIRIGTWLINIVKRFIVQLILPNTVRGLVFKKFARRRVE